VQGSRETSLYVLDCLFSVLIVGTLVVFVWRGAWTILDLCLYPSHQNWSAWTSMVSTLPHVAMLPLVAKCMKVTHNLEVWSVLRYHIRNYPTDYDKIWY